MPHAGVAAGVAAGLVGIGALVFAYLIVREVAEAVQQQTTGIFPSWLEDDEHLDVYGTDDEFLVHDERWDVQDGGF